MRSENEAEPTRVSKHAEVAFLVDLDHPVGETGPGFFEVGLDHGQLLLVLLRGRLGLLQLGVGGVVLLDGRFDLGVQFVDLFAQSVGLALGFVDGGSLSPRDTGRDERDDRTC